MNIALLEGGEPARYALALQCQRAVLTLRMLLEGTSYNPAALASPLRSRGASGALQLTSRRRVRLHLAPRLPATWPLRPRAGTRHGHWHWPVAPEPWPADRAALLIAAPAQPPGASQLRARLGRRSSSPQRRGPRAETELACRRRRRRRRAMPRMPPPTTRLPWARLDGDEAAGTPRARAGATDCFRARGRAEPRERGR